MGKNRGQSSMDKHRQIRSSGMVTVSRSRRQYNILIREHFFFYPENNTRRPHLNIHISTALSPLILHSSLAPLTNGTLIVYHIVIV